MADKDQSPSMKRNPDEIASPGPRAGEEEKVKLAKEWADKGPEAHRGPGGESFYNPGAVGSGTIMSDGTYGPPLPDPNLLRRQEDPEVTTDLQDADPHTRSRRSRRTDSQS